MDIFYSIVASVVVQAIFLVLIKNYFENSIKHSFDIKLLEYQTILARREKAAQLAYALARWIKYRGHENEWLNEKELADYYEELTRLSFELSLVLEDEKLLLDVMKKFEYPENKTHVKDLIFALRKILQEKPDEIFKSENIVTWPKDETFYIRK